MHPTLAFIGGGNMASAILGGLRRAGRPADAFLVVEPFESQRARLHAEFGVTALAAPDPRLADASMVIWAVKPQLFAEAAAPAAPWIAQALHLSVMAGIRSASLVQAAGTERVVRSMPNTPALIGQGIAGLYARDAVTELDRAEVDAVLAPTGRTVWVEREDDLDAVTALSGSGPAYFFYVVEAMIQAGLDLGLHETQARELALATCGGAAALALQSGEPVSTLRERVTSKGGTTHAALESLRADGVGEAVQRAVRAAAARAAELGRAG
ncbi:pyrroline-5-carboxylate reductase [Inhella gelatinilytica]|uniref:Pyrroline-5-carboxylate reductase n=1 Tax=Inhella gelatinilytica TaxID=2795030 RepID=A0A931NA66_9BURK|nr:pyrroline-5-carboxylate reductase [Inhella gelatinilytica]MBH9552138.1 pyrroline-5-carboxylate reductase [Inhella gelatinilytica]